MKGFNKVFFRNKLPPMGKGEPRLRRSLLVYRYWWGFGILITVAFTNGRRSDSFRIIEYFNVDERKLLKIMGLTIWNTKEKNES